jgi:uncharacterized protein (TIGR02569 family)
VTAPSPAVLTAFGCDGTPSALAGGRGLSWRSGDVVLKPAEENPEISDWLCDALDGLVPDGFRVCAPIRAATGGWRFDGWTASVFEPGTPADVTGGPWIDVLQAGAAFCRALAGLERPWFTTIRDDPWAIADRVAWQEESVQLPEAYDAVVRRLAALAGDRPDDPDQVVHGDLPGNVLLHPGLVPLILDFSPYWRPMRYSLAIVVTDALSWHDAEPSLLLEARPFLGQHAVAYLARSLMFRTVVAGLWAATAGSHEVDVDLAGFARTADQLTVFAETG